VSYVHSLVAGVVDKLWIFLVDRVVGEVDVLLAQVVLVGSNIGLGCKPCQALLVNVDSHRTNTTQ
jgi:hypothetical protein